MFEAFSFVSMEEFAFQTAVALRGYLKTSPSTRLETPEEGWLTAVLTVGWGFFCRFSETSLLNSEAANRATVRGFLPPLSRCAQEDARPQIRVTLSSEPKCCCPNSECVEGCRRPLCAASVQLPRRAARCKFLFSTYSGEACR